MMDAWKTRRTDTEIISSCDVISSNASAANLAEESSLQSVHSQPTEVFGGFGQRPFSQGGYFKRVTVPVEFGFRQSKT